MKITVHYSDTVQTIGDSLDSGGLHIRQDPETNYFVWLAKSIYSLSKTSPKTANSRIMT